MKQVLGVAWLLGLSALGCSGGASSERGAGSSHLRLEVSCSANSDCPATFECEAETEHGVTTTFCSSIEPISADGVGGAMCPNGYEVEVEHGVSFCKPHGGDDHGAGGRDDGASHDAGDDHGAGGSDDGASHDAGDDHGAGGSDDSSKGKGK